MNLKRKTSGQTHSEGTENIIEPQDWQQFMEDIFCELSRYDYLRITPDTNIPVPVPVIKIKGETISTAGNITTISGESKSGKSALISWFLAGAISTTGIIFDPLQDLEVEPNYEGKAVIHIDTEQSRYDHQKKQRTILKRAGFEKCPRYFLSYNIRQLDLQAYTLFAQNVCSDANRHFGGIHLIAIDGGADFIRNVNDPETSNAIVKIFGDLAIQYNVPLVIIVHTNPGGEKERGHFGSECQRRSESILRVRKNDDISHIEPAFLRNAGNGAIPRIQFTYDKEKGYHVSCGLRASDAVDRDAERMMLLERVAREVFPPPMALKNKTCEEKVMEATGRSISVVKNMLAEMRAHRLIIKGDDGLWLLNTNNVV